MSQDHSKAHDEDDLELPHTLGRFGERKSLLMQKGLSHLGWIPTCEVEFTITIFFHPKKPPASDTAKHGENKNPQ